MTVTGNALAMRLKLKQLAVRHGVAPQSTKLPLFDPSEFPMIMEGYCSTAEHVDADRTKFRPFCFGYLPFVFRNGYPPLHLKHDCSREVGKIDQLSYDDFGSLCCWTTVTDPMAKRMPAFSIAATVNAFELVNEDTPDFFALITSASISEVSLTDIPANRFAKVMDRYRQNPHTKTFELLIEKIKVLQKMTAHLKELNHG
jgi:hypothetical protein